MRRVFGKNQGSVFIAILSDIRRGVVGGHGLNKRARNNPSPFGVPKMCPRQLNPTQFEPTPANWIFWNKFDN